MNKCRFCKVNFEDNCLMISSIDKTGQYKYYSCRPCNAERVRKQRKTLKGKIWKKKAELNYIKNKKDFYKEYHDAIIKGYLKKPTTCSICNSSGTIDGHHEDYLKPLFVVWLCRKCHSKKHNKMIGILKNR